MTKLYQRLIDEDEAHLFARCSGCAREYRLTELREVCGDDYCEECLGIHATDAPDVDDDD